MLKPPAACQTSLAMAQVGEPPELVVRPVGMALPDGLERVVGSRSSAAATAVAVQAARRVRAAPKGREARRIPAARLERVAPQVRAACLGVVGPPALVPWVPAGQLDPAALSVLEALLPQAAAVRPAEPAARAAKLGPAVPRTAVQPVVQPARRLLPRHSVTPARLHPNAEAAIVRAVSAAIRPVRASVSNAPQRDIVRCLLTTPPAAR